MDDISVGDGRLERNLRQILLWSLSLPIHLIFRLAPFSETCLQTLVILGLGDDLAATPALSMLLFTAICEQFCDLAVRMSAWLGEGPEIAQTRVASHAFDNAWSAAAGC